MGMKGRTSLFSDELAEKYEFVNHGHAAEILQSAYSDEWNDISNALSNFSMSSSEIIESGGAVSTILNLFESLFQQHGWKNTLLKATLHLQYFERIAGQRKYADIPYAEHDVNNYLSGQRLDYLKNGVGICLEWNKKDIAFDRDLSALRAFYELNCIGVGVIITRSDELDTAFEKIFTGANSAAGKKYTSSTTHLGKLIPRIDSRQAGGCPILAIGIKSGCISDLGAETDE